MSLLIRLCLVVSLFSAQLALAEPLALFPGWPVEVTSTKVARFNVVDPAIAEASLSPTGNLVVTGLKEGRTTLSFVTAAGEQVLELNVQVSGWQLVSVAVAAVPIREETVLTKQMLVVRQIPRAFVTASVVKADSLHYLLDQPLQIPVQAGDLLLWSTFEVKPKKR